MRVMDTPQHAVHDIPVKGDHKELHANDASADDSCVDHDGG
jgi:hypothetical protein